MTKTWREIRDIDILAYADGLLEGDPARKAAVEAYLERNPFEAERVAAIERDNEELRALYAGELDRPIPERHLQALYASTLTSGRMTRAIAAGVVLIILAAGGGWLLGRYDENARSASDELLRVAAQYSVSAQSVPLFNAAERQAIGGRPQPLPRESIWLGIRLPDVSAEGFELVDSQRLASSDREITQLVYRADGTILNLFVRPRGGEDTAGIRQAKVEGRTVHYWPGGPVVFALTTSADDQHARRLADRLRDAMDQSKFVYEPPVTVTPEKRGKAMVGDGTRRDQQLNTAGRDRKTGLPLPRQVN